jgi:hypothetical protein
MLSNNHLKSLEDKMREAPRRLPKNVWEEYGIEPNPPPYPKLKPKPKPNKTLAFIFIYGTAMLLAVICAAATMNPWVLLVAWIWFLMGLYQSSE